MHHGHVKIMYITFFGSEVSFSNNKAVSGVIVLFGILLLTASAEAALCCNLRNSQGIGLTDISSLSFAINVSHESHDCAVIQGLYFGRSRNRRSRSSLSVDGETNGGAFETSKQPYIHCSITVHDIYF